MHISRLDLYGFKSFPDRTVLQFGEGVSCVVGPNGSGKSNVVDALRWCIGEQSPRSLRGSEMADVIFAGSADRRPVGFAEVQITLVSDNGEPFPGDYAALHEVQVGRRLHRSGTSEYLINQHRVRRRDVVELLMDTGIGNNLYSFIEQGQVDKVITASPEERRSVIDEAAGIARYKSRREEARGRMEATAAQLDRAADVADEMARRLRSLERQAHKAAEFRRLRARIRLAELRLSLAKVQALAADRRALRETQRALKGREAAARREQARRDEDLSERREEIELVEGGVASRRDRVAELDAHIREQEAIRGFHEKRLDELGSEMARAVAEKERAQGDVITAQAQEARHREQVASLAAAEAEWLGKEASTQRVLSEARAQRDQKRIDLEAARASLEGVVRARLEDEAALAGLRARVEDAQGRAAHNVELRAAAERALAEAGEERAQAEQRWVDAQGLQAKALATTAEHEEAFALARSRSTEADAQVDAAVLRREERWATKRREDQRIDARGRAWVEATEEGLQADLVTLELHWRRRLADLRGQAAAEAESLARAAGEAAMARSQAAVAVAEGAATAARTADHAAENAVAAAESRVQTLRERAHTAGVRRAETKGRLAVLRAQMGEQIEALEGHPRLIDEVVDRDARRELVQRLGASAFLRVVRDARHMVALQAARPQETPVAVWWLPGAREPSMAGAPWLPSMDEALAAEGEAIGQDFRVLPSGVVELGATDAHVDLVAEEQSLLAALAALEHELSTSATEIDAAAGALAQARSGRVATRQTDVQAREELERIHGLARAALDEAHGEALQAAAVRVAELERDMDGQRAQALEAARGVRAATLLAVRAEAEALADTLRRGADTSAADGALADARAGAAEARAQLESASALRDDARASAQIAQREADRAQMDVSVCVEALARAESEQVRLQDEGTTIEAQRQRLADRLNALETARAAAPDDEVEAEHFVGERAGDLAAAEAGSAAAEASLAKVHAEIGAVRERLAAGRAGLEAVQAVLQAGQGAVGRAADQVVATEEAMAVAGQSRDAAMDALEQASTTRSEAWNTLEVERSRLKRLRTGLQEAEQALRGIREQVDALAAEAEGLAQRIGTVQAELEVIRLRMEDRYQVSIHGMLDRLHTRGRIRLEVDRDVQEGLELGGRLVEGVQEVELRPGDLVDEAAVVDQVSSLEVDRGLLAALGEVNLAALQEHRELAERHGELDAQRDDLEASLKSIQSAIAKMNRLCRERFREAFDQVNEHFQTTYPRLVGGGNARLSLTDDEDVLEAGVDIFVQPPGKRLQNLGLLSGGEKAMTAIALLISLFHVKPSPFCVLDEVDAPLDEANGARFNEMLREMAARSQFLVITHNRKTMECADTLYGITMARPGVSRLVTVRIQ